MIDRIFATKYNNSNIYYYNMINRTYKNLPKIFRMIMNTSQNCSGQKGLVNVPS